MGGLGLLVSSSPVCTHPVVLGTDQCCNSSHIDDNGVLILYSSSLFLLLGVNAGEEADVREYKLLILLTSGLPDAIDVMAAFTTSS